MSRGLFPRYHTAYGTVTSDCPLDIKEHMIYSYGRLMTLSEYILENTDDGIDIAHVLIHVMNGFIRGTTPGHRLAAARLLTIYGFQDARDFIDDNTLPSSDEGRRWVITDPELARLIRARTNDGQEMCQFLIDVMWGRVERTRIGHRVSAARELLNRAFGKNQGLPLPNPPSRTAPRGTIKRTDLQAESEPVHPEPVEEQPPLPEGEGWGEGEKVVRPEPVEGQSAPPAQEQGPEANPNFDPDIYRAASRCIAPDFDPMRAATDDDYFWNYDGCDNISCPYHGDPEDPDYIPNYDPNTHHY